MCSGESSTTESDTLRLERDLEARVEALATVAWKALPDDPRGTEAARRAAELTRSAGATARTVALGMAADVRAALSADPQELKPLCVRALDSLEGLDDVGTWQCRVLLTLAVAEAKRGHYADAEPLFARGLRLAREHQLLRLELETLIHLGTVSQCTGQSTQALAYVVEAQALAERVGDRHFEGVALAQLGAYQRMRGAYPEATASLLAGIELLGPSDGHEQVATAYCELALIQTLMKKYADAVESVDAALARLEDTLGSPSTAYALSALAFVHTHAGDLDAALDAAERALEIRQRLGRPADEASSRLQLGDVLLKCGRLEEAEAHYREALPTAEAFDEVRIVVDCKCGLAQVCEAGGDLQGALDLATPLLSILQELGDEQSLADLCDLLARLHESNGDAPAALESHKRARAFRDEIFNRESDARLQHLQITHKLTHQRRQAAEALRMLSRRLLESLEAERKHVARELHDDLSQRLALLAVELDVLSRAPPTSTSETSERFDALADEVRVIEERVYRISHRLHPAMLEQLGLVTATQVICEESAATYDVEIVFRAEELSWDLSDEIELGIFRVAQEALRNAIRHGRPKSVSMHLFEGLDGVSLRIRDDGVGFDSGSVSGTGIGLVGMRERIDHLGGEINIRSAPGRGTVVEVDVPCPPHDG